VKKGILIGGMAASCTVAFVLSVALFVRLRGGVGADHALARLPLVGSIMRAPGEPADRAREDEAGQPSETPGTMPFLPANLHTRLKRMTGDLALRKGELDEALRRAHLRERELTAWAQQLKKERDEVRATLEAQKQALAVRQTELQQREEALARRIVVVRAGESAALAKTAEKYAGIKPDVAARILVEIYGGAQTSPDKKDLVVKILHSMESRQAAKVLEAIAGMPDVGLQAAAEITEQLRAVTEEIVQGE